VSTEDNSGKFRIGTAKTSRPPRANFRGPKKQSQPLATSLNGDIIRTTQNFEIIDLTEEVCILYLDTAAHILI